jgi:hypothetical protein
VSSNQFYALTLAQYEDLLQTADPLMQSLEKLDSTVNEAIDAKNSAALTEHQKAIVAAKAAVNQQMRGMVKDGPEDIAITEVIHFIGRDPSEKNGKGKYSWLNRKHTFIKSDKMKSHWRSYQLDKDFANESRINKMKKFYEKMRDPSTGKLSHKKLLHAAAKAIKTAPTKIQLVSFNTAAAYKTFASTVGNEHFNVSKAASLFRATAGAGVHGGYNKKSGKLSFSADGNAEADLLSAQGTFNCFIPSKEGFEINISLPDKTKQFRDVNLGCVRANLQATVDAFVGATVAAGANLNLSLKHVDDNPQGIQKMKLMGNNKLAPHVEYKNPAEKSKAERQAFKTNVNAFVGAKAGGELQSSISWQNPDKLSAAKQQQAVIAGNDASPSNLQKAGIQAADESTWQDFCAIELDGSAAIGVGAGCGFSIGYNKQLAKFYIHAHAEAVMGPGVSGSIGYVVEAGHIMEFIAFVYHKIKDYNFAYLGMFMVEHAVDAYRAIDAYKQYTLMMLKYLMEKGFELGDKLEEAEDAFENWWLHFVLSIEKEVIYQEKADEAAQNIINDPDRLKYTLPEVKGQLLTFLGDAPTPNEDIQTAMLIILAYIQSRGDYDNVVQHLNLDGTKLSVEAGHKRLHQLLGHDAKDYIDNIPGFNKEFFVDSEEIIATIPKNTPVKTLVNVEVIKKQYNEIVAVQRQFNAKMFIV